jgi:hypothetical protein
VCLKLVDIFYFWSGDVARLVSVLRGALRLLRDIFYSLYSNHQTSVSVPNDFICSNVNNFYFRRHSRSSQWIVPVLPYATNMARQIFLFSSFLLVLHAKIFSRKSLLRLRQLQQGRPVNLSLSPVGSLDYLSADFVYDASFPIHM